MKKQIGVALVVLTLAFGATTYATGNGEVDHCKKENYDKHKCEKKDLCPNLVGIQYKIPPELMLDEQGNCVPPPPKDVCPNIEGVQTTVPEGKELKDGQCVDKVTPPVTPPATPPASPPASPPKSETPVIPPSTSQVESPVVNTPAPAPITESPLK